MSSISCVSSCDTLDACEPKVRYQAEDRRKNIYELDRSDDFYDQVAKQARSVAVMMTDCKLSDYSTMPTLSQVVKKETGSPYGEQELFREERLLGNGTAFLVSRRLVLTARHCVCIKNTNKIDQKRIKRTSIIFGFYLKTAGQKDFSFKAKNVYTVRKVVFLSQDRQSDWALIKLDRDVEGRPPLSLDFATKMEVGDGLYMLGHPSGLPMKYTYDAQVRPGRSSYMETDLDAFHGNSGSPVFDETTQKVVGILVRGQPIDYSSRVNYRNTGHTRSGVHRPTESEISKDGYEKVQKLNASRFDICAEDYIFAHSGDTDAQYDLGVAYFRGEGVEQNKRKGMKWLRRAKKEGPAMAKKVDRFIAEFLELEAEKALTLGTLALQNQQNSRLVKTIGYATGGIVLLPLTIVALPLVYVHINDVIREEQSRKFELLALEDPRFKIFEHLANGDMEEANEAFEENKSFFNELTKTKAFQREFMECIFSSARTIWGTATAKKHNNYIDFFLDQKMIPKDYKQLRFQNAY